MRYLAIANSIFKDSPSGSARVAWDISCLVRARGHHVTFVCSSPHVAPGVTEKSTEEGIQVIRFGRPRVRVPSVQSQDAYKRGVAAALEAHARDLKPDVVHLHSLLPATAAIACLGEDRQYVATVYSPVVPEARVNWLAQGIAGRLKILLGGLERLRRMQEAVLAHCRRVHVLSAYAADQLARYHGELPACSVIPHWHRPLAEPQPDASAARSALKWRHGEKVLFSLRRLVARMGHKVAIEAIGPLLRRYDARMVFAGEGPLLVPLRDLARSIDGDRIEFVGRVSDRQAAAMYAAADLFVQPTVTLECFGLTVMEALGAGCPVLATRAGAIPEMMGRVLPGFLVSEGSVAELRAHAEAFLSGRLRSPPADTLRRFVAESYGEAVVTPRLERFIEQ